MSQVISTPLASAAKRPSLWPQRLLVLGISTALYIAACALPVMTMVVDKDPPVINPGLYFLAFGWTALFIGNFAWLANLLLPIAWLLLLFRQWLIAIVPLLLGLLIALQTYALLGQDLPADEGGIRRMHVTTIGIGFYFWLASFAAPLLGALWLRLLSRRTPTA